MNNMLRKRINELAYDILAVYDIATPIDNIESVVKKIGGQIQETDELDFLTDGKVKKDRDSFIITVPESQSNSLRRNFTIAHELGHLFLHMGYQIDEELWENSDNMTLNRFGNSERELEANEFAAAFLMPEKEYKRIAEKYSEGNTVFIRRVAEYFNVSVEAASYRGKWLGYLQW